MNRAPEYRRAPPGISSTLLPKRRRVGERLGVPHGEVSP